jgi:hypothetical protein
MSQIQKWSVKGRWFDVCRCAVPCPCSWAQPPDDDFCDGSLLWHIDEGHYGGTRLDGLNMAMVIAFKGNFWGKDEKEGPRDMKNALFVDARADDDQRGALQSIFGGQAGGWPQMMSKALAKAEMKGFEVATIDLDIAPDLSSWRAEVPGKLRAAASALFGPTSNGKVPEIRNLPGAETGPGGVATWGKVTADTVDAFGFQWDRAGKSSKLIAFEWSGPD